MLYISCSHIFQDYGMLESHFIKKTQRKQVFFKNALENKAKKNPNKLAVVSNMLSLTDHESTSLSIDYQYVTYIGKLRVLL